MDLVRLIEALSSPRAYPEPPSEVQIRQTHISVVFLAGRQAYKIKKPVALGFLDLATGRRVSLGELFGAFPNHPRTDIKVAMQELKQVQLANNPE